MIKTLIRLKIQSFIQGQAQVSKTKKGTMARLALLAFLILYVAVVFIGMFGALFEMIIEPMRNMHLEWLYFAIMSICVIMICFIGSIFLTHHELYEAKDNELLMSMPIKNRDILLSRLFTILLFDYLYEILIVVPAFYIYMLHIGMTVGQMIIFVIVVMTLPLLVLVLSSLFSWVLAHTLVHIRFKNVVTIVMFCGFMFLYFYIVNSVEGYLTYLILHGISIANAIKETLYPIYHLSIAITQTRIFSLFIYLACVLIPFIIVLYLLSRNFITLATSKPQQKKKKYVRRKTTLHSCYKALFIREVKHFTSNAMVMLNAAAGVLMSLFAIVGLFVYKNDFIGYISSFSSYIDLSQWFLPISCIALMSICSLNMISASSISLEGQQLWILKTIPVNTKQILLSKAMFHFIVCTPTSLILACFILMIQPFNTIEATLVIISPLIFTIFTDLLGLLLNIWKPKLDWRNETVCVKQSMPVTLIMLISIGTIFVLAMLYMLLKGVMSSLLCVVTLLCVLILIDCFLYYLLNTWGIRTFEQY